MNETLGHIVDTLKYYYTGLNTLGALGIFLLAGGIFMTLAWLFPSRKQPLLRKSMIADACYWFLGGPLLYRWVSQAIFLGLAYMAIFIGLYTYEDINSIHKGLAPVATLPVLLQAFIILLVTDFIQYWMHRMFHRNTFWKWHAIHHSPTDVDWLTSARFHPVNIIVYSTFVNTLVYMAGFSPEAFLILGPFNAIYSPLVHANVNWTYGPFRYFLASPTFHRWHHTHIEEGGNKNFAPTFPFIDLMFGTYYDPKDKKPEVFGIKGNPISDTNVFEQLMYPFRKERKQITMEATNGQF